ncbi:lytic transglycosylase domain-containing protein [Bradyrhizobium sp. Pa8]|uniref:lytic transglycosylase domain-containing protein n=1 Tax=Bradyrhizobium sp. Pa8 TaxID=3386552 RepID=UPI00403F1792
MAVCVLGAVLVLKLPSDAWAETAVPTPGAQSPSSQDADSYPAFVAEASRRFSLPDHWIRAVLQVESRGDVRAVSLRGALGLMQIMPQTWVDLGTRYNLGVDPFDPRDNILAGAAYLREMLDRFGFEGFLAAYNAGPRRYEAYLATGQPLPQETEIYVARLVRLIEMKQHEHATLVIRHTIPWQQAVLFFDRSGGSSATARTASALHPVSGPNDRPSLSAPALVLGATQLFVQRSTGAQFR